MSGRRKTRQQSFDFESEIVDVLTRNLGPVAAAALLRRKPPRSRTRPITVTEHVRWIRVRRAS